MNIVGSTNTAISKWRTEIQRESKTSTPRQSTNTDAEFHSKLLAFIRLDIREKYGLRPEGHRRSQARRSAAVLVLARWPSNASAHYSVRNQYNDALQ